MADAIERSSEEPTASFSVSWKLRRTIFEYAFVSIAVEPSVLNMIDGRQGRIDANKMALRAIEQGRESNVKWTKESEFIDLHPNQTPSPETRNG